jgi:hemerythrin-like metal-binding protein
MQRFKWTKEHAVFLPDVDAEHRNLFHLADQLEAAVLAKADAAQVLETLRALIAATEDHFSHEERQMRSTHYPSYAWHKQQHDTLRKRMSQFVPRIESGDGEAALLLLEFLSGWLKDHTALTDRMMGAYLRNYERQAAPALPVREAARGVSA